LNRHDANVAFGLGLAGFFGGKCLEHLGALESKSLQILREAYQRFKGQTALLWSGGKDSTAMLWLARKAFLGRIPFPVIHIDISHRFPEMSEFRDRLAREWNLEVIVAKNQEQLRAETEVEWGMSPSSELTTDTLKLVISEHGLQAVLMGVRGDEYGIGTKDQDYFQPGDSHHRVYPILHFTELDLWRYIRQEGIPIADLYRSRGGKRYTSIGCVHTSLPVESDATTIDDMIEELERSPLSEQAENIQGEESAILMERLRSLGYL
jgi:sulfate adenylyltransferase subunit 2